MFLATKQKSGPLATVHRTHTPTQSIFVYDILETLGNKQSRLTRRFITLFILFYHRWATKTEQNGSQMLKHFLKMLGIKG